MGKRSEFLEFAVEVAEKAGDVIMRYHGQQLERDYTDKTHFKTLVDDKNDKLACLAIRTRFPSHNFYRKKARRIKANRI